MGNLAVAEIEPVMMLAALRKVEARGATEKAAKTRCWCGEVFRYAVATRRAKFNPAGELKSAMVKHKSTRHPFLRVDQLPDFLTVVDGYTGSVIRRLGLQILMLSGLRTQELRYSQWDGMDLDGEKLWSIPVEVMKMSRPHIVPLSSQLIGPVARTQETERTVYEYVPRKERSLKGDE